MRGQRIVPAALAWPLRIIPARAGPTGPTATKAATRPDHPRSCGANLFARVQISDIRGSSPLVRGQPCIVRCHPGISEDHPRSCGGQLCMSCDFHETPRIIPARAGPTRDFSATECPGTDHPRSCGANAVCDIGCKLCCGSSPLVRGQLNVFLGFFHQLRIIPARAGPTPFLRPRPGFMPDHPRSCGANRLSHIGYQLRYGSSPLVRGQQTYPRI